MKDSGIFSISWKMYTIRSNETLERMRMPRILVPPEVLMRVSEEAARAAEELETTKNRLDQQITYMMSSWEGTTRSRFFEDFQRAHGELK